MDTVTIKLPPQINRRLTARAKKLNQKKSKFVRDLIERALDGTAESCHDLMQGGCGHYAGPKESSLKEGFDDKNANRHGSSSRLLQLGRGEPEARIAG
jgi:hypothetical protein